MKNINILIIDDEPDITEIVGLLIGSHFSSDFSYANTGKAAVALLAEGKIKFDLIISDFNMPNGNGKLVYEYVRQNLPLTPFILLTSDNLSEHPQFVNQPITYYIQKPFDEDNLLVVTRKALEALPPIENIYIGITLATLLKIQKITTPLFVKLNDNKYVKVINEGNIFDEAEYQKYKQKNISSLYVIRENYNDLVKEFKTKVLTDLFFTTFKSEAKEEFQISASVNEIINSTIVSFGFSDQTVNLAKENVKLVKSIVDRSSDLQSLLRWIDGNEFKYELTHSMLICFLSSAISQKFKFQNPHAAEYIALAAFFHDISLDAYQIENEQRFREALRQGIQINKSDIDIIRLHPKKSAEMLSTWNMCPKEVLAIVENHCERPDGKGFPLGLDSTNLDEMSACFIFCEDLVNFVLASRSKSRIQEYLDKNAELYSELPFSNFLEIVKELSV